MALRAQHKEQEFGVGDKIRVLQKIKEAGKERSQSFEGIVIAIRGREGNKTFTVRRIGAQQIGIERIFPLSSPTIEEIEVVTKGTTGVRRAKLYYIRGKTKREIEEIYSRVARKGAPIREAHKKKVTKPRVKKSAVGTTKKTSVK